MNPSASSSLSTWLLAAALVSLPASAAWANERSGVFKNMNGDVSVLRGTQRVPAVPGAALREGDRVVTGPNSAAAVTLRDGTVLSVGPNASLDLTHYSFDSTSQNGSLLMNLLQGTVRVVTGLLGQTNPELVKLTTPTAIIGVRGTDFIVEATQ